MASTYLTRTPSSTGNRQIFTFSAWVKRSSITTSDTLFYTGPNAATSGMISLRFTSSGTINVYQTDIGSFITTNRLFRDTSAWYHIVLAIDTTQATPDDRRKLYINGVQETSFSTSTEVNLNLSLSVNTTGELQRIGVHANSAGSPGEYFDGSMSDVHFIDGTAYAASDFGETDTDTGEWKPTGAAVTYGTNGFRLKFENAGSMGLDSSGNSNAFTVSGTPTQTQDCPSDVFATMNPLDNFYQGGVFTNGNNTVQMTNQPAYLTATMGISSGKYYWEAKMSAGGAARESDIIGMANAAVAMMWASFAGSLVAFTLVITQRVLTFKETMEAWIDGAKS